MMWSAVLVRLPLSETVDFWLFPLPIHYGKGARGLGRPHTNWDPLFPFDVKIARASGLFSRRTGRELWKATALRPIPLAPFPAGKGEQTVKSTVSVRGRPARTFLRAERGSVFS